MDLKVIDGYRKPRGFYKQFYHKPRGFYKQFETGKIVEFEGHKYQENEYRGIIIRRCIDKEPWIDNNYWTMHFPGSNNNLGANCIRFFTDKYQHIFQQSVVGGKLKNVLDIIDQALYFKDKDLPYGTMYIHHIPGYTYKNYEIDYETLKNKLIEKGFKFSENMTKQEHDMIENRTFVNGNLKTFLENSLKYF